MKEFQPSAFSRIPYLSVIIFLCLLNSSLSQDTNEFQTSTPGLPTVTVRGFLNFRTTVDGTVIVFTPASEIQQPATLLPNPKPTSTLFLSSSVTSVFFEPNNDFREKELGDGVQDLSFSSSSQNRVEIPNTQLPNLMENKIKDSFLNHISDDNAVLPSNDQENNSLERIKKPPASQNQLPTGLVTVLGGTFADGDSKTVLETKVIGTYIEGKYAQILQSTSRVVSEVISPVNTPKLTYSTIERRHSHELDRISSNSPISFIPSSQHFVISSTIPATSAVASQLFKPFSDPSAISQSSVAPSVSSRTVHSSVILPLSLTTNQLFKQLLNSPTIQPPKIVTAVEFSIATQPKNVHRHENDKMYSYTKKTNSLLPSTSSKIEKFEHHTTIESSFIEKIVVPSLDFDDPTESLESGLRSTSGFKKSFIPLTSTMLRIVEDSGTSTAVHKNSGSSTLRTRFLPPRRPSQSVRLNRFKVKLTLRQDAADEDNVHSTTDDDELEDDQTHKYEDDLDLATEELGVIGVDPAKVVFQETTIVSEVTLHVGRRKSVRTLTITTSVPLTIHPSDIPDILASQSSSMDREASDQSLIVTTRTYTTTERALKTSVVPVFDGKSTSYHTITESFFILKLITAYRTFPPREASALESAFEEAEIAATTLEAAANFPPSTFQTIAPEHLQTEVAIRPSLVLPAKGEAYQPLTNPFLSLGHALSNNPLAAVYLGLQQLNAHMTLYSTMTDTSTYVTTDTFYATRTIKFYDGRSTKYRTVSDPISTKKRTVTTTLTSVKPYLNTQALQQQEQLQKLVAATRMNPLELQFSTQTSTFETVTTTTSLSTRVYTLIYNGFSTKLRTVTSTSTYPATITVTSVKKVPLSPTNMLYPYSA